MANFHQDNQKVKNQINVITDNIEYKYHLQSKVLKWLLTSNDVGMSSQAMASAAVGIFKNKNHPYDPSDLNRCIKLMKEIPEIADNLDEIAKLSPTWSKLIDNWHELERCFIDEVGLDWSKGNRAPITYRLIKSIID